MGLLGFRFCLIPRGIASPLRGSQQARPNGQEE